MGDLTVACIGAGYFAQFHYEAWARIPDAKLIASVDKNEELARKTGLTPYDDVDRMLASKRPDILDIITPPKTHLAIIQKALKAHPKAIICQKPFCQSMDEAKLAVDLSAEEGIPIIVHENFRFQPWYRAMRRLIVSGNLGDVLQMTFRLRPGDGQGPNAYLDRQPYFQTMPRFLIHETGVHWIDTFRFLMGEPKAVFADLRQLNPAISGEDSGLLLFDYGGGKRAIFDGNRLLDHAATNTRCTMGEALIEGTKGTLSLNGDGSVYLRKFGHLDTELVLAPLDQSSFGGDCVFELQRHVIKALQTNAPFENQAKDYLRVIEIENAVYKSANDGTWVEL